MKVMVVGSEGIVGRALINSFDTSLKNLSICLVDPNETKTLLKALLTYNHNIK